MGQQIPFPQNFAQLVRLGKMASEQRKWPQAIAHLRAAYQYKQTFDVNILLVTALLADQQYQQAAALAQEKVTDYLSSATACPLYVKTLLTTHQFIAVRKLCIARPAGLETSFWHQQALAVQQAEVAYRTAAPTQIAKLKKALYQLSACHFYDQLALTKQAQFLPQTEFIDAVTHLLTDPYIHPLIRAHFLNELRQLKVATALNFFWLDGKKHTVKPSALTAITTAPQFLQLYQQINQQLLSDPIAKQNVLKELTLHAAYLYPFADKVIVRPQIWTAVYLAAYTNRQVDLTVFDSTQVQQIQNWQQRFEQLTQKLE